MSIQAGSLDYAQARLQARHGTRTDAGAAAGWQHVETVRELHALLEGARGTALRPWLVGITAASSSDEIEAVLRAHWRDFVDEVAAWMPPAWQPAVVWCAWLPELAPLQHLARGEEPAAWLLADPTWREVVAARLGVRRRQTAGATGVSAGAADGASDGSSDGLSAGSSAGAADGASVGAADGASDGTQDGGRLAGRHRRADAQGPASPACAARLLASAGDDPAAIGRAWRDEWHRRWPRMTADARQALADLERVVADHITRYAHGTTAGGPLRRAALTARLALLWRRVALQPAAAFVQLALAAVDLERLRGELLRRRLFPRWSPARC